MHLITGAKESWINGFVKQWVIGGIKGAPSWTGATRQRHLNSFLEVEETWKSLLFWLERKIAQ